MGEQADRLARGEWYLDDDELRQRRLDCARRLDVFNTAPADADETRSAVLSALFGAAGQDSLVVPRFHCSYGANIRRPQHRGRCGQRRPRRPAGSCRCGVFTGPSHSSHIARSAGVEPLPPRATAEDIRDRQTGSRMSSAVGNTRRPPSLHSGAAVGVRLTHHLRFLTSSVSCGATLNRSPTMP